MVCGVLDRRYLVSYKEYCKNNPNVVIIAVVVLVALAVLVFIFRDGFGSPEVSEQVNEQQPTQPADPEKAVPPLDPQNPPLPVDPPEEMPPPSTSGSDTEEVALPDNWDELTRVQKIVLNPYQCDIETHWISAENGRCIDKSSSRSPRLFSVAPFAVEFDNGLEVEVSVRVSCESVESKFRTLYGDEYLREHGYWSDVAKDFFKHLEGRGIDVPAVDTLIPVGLSKAFFDYAERHLTDWCFVRVSFKNTGEDYVYIDTGCPGGNAVYARVLLNQGEHPRDYSVFYPKTNFTPLPCVVDAPSEQQFESNAISEMGRNMFVRHSLEIKTLRLIVTALTNSNQTAEKTVDLPLGT